MTWPVGDRPLVEDVDRLDRHVAADYQSVWSLEGSATDAFTPLAVAAVRQPTISVGSAIASIYSRGPALLAMEAATVATCVGADARFMLGLGTSTPLLAAGWNDRSFDRPAQRMSDTLEFLRAAFAGERIDRTWPTFTIDKFTLHHRPSRPPTLLVAALGERMLDVADRHGDGLILNWAAPVDVERLRDAAANCSTVAARLFVTTNDDREAVHATARSTMLPYLCAGGYEGFHRRMGRELDEVWEHWSHKRYADAAAAIPAGVIDDLVIHGTATECHSRIDDYVQRGVTDPIVAAIPVGDHRAERTIDDLAARP